MDFYPLLFFLFFKFCHKNIKLKLSYQNAIKRNSIIVVFDINRFNFHAFLWTFFCWLMQTSEIQSICLSKMMKQKGKHFSNNQFKTCLSYSINVPGINIQKQMKFLFRFFKESEPKKKVYVCACVFSCFCKNLLECFKNYSKITKFTQ